MRLMRLANSLTLLWLCVLLAGCSAQRSQVTHASTNPPTAFHLHLPGIGGLRSIDRAMLRGLREGGYEGEIEPYDWTENNPGFAALLNHHIHTAEAKKVAGMIEDQHCAHPEERFTVTAHSGGAAIIIWALEKLPPGVKVDEVILLSPALSPGYDLSKALRHVRGKMYVFYSQYDATVLGAGTELFGTMDGVKCDAAGKVGFRTPGGADAAQYARLDQVPYNSNWIRLGNIGDHIGALTEPFGRVVIAPLVMRGELVRVPPMAPFTQVKAPSAVVHAQATPRSIPAPAQ